MSRKNEKGTRENKKHNCLYCYKLYPNIARHLERKHKDEIDVAKVLILPKKSYERRKAWEKLVNEGDFAHNYNVLEKGDGQIIPKYRCSNREKSIKLIPCTVCHGMYRKNELWQHFKKCSSSLNSKDNEKINVGPVAGGKKLMPKCCSSEIFHVNIIDKMRDDSIKAAVLSDPSIIKIGMNMYADHGIQNHRHVYISNKMREMGRLLIELKKNGISSISQAIDRANWDILVSSVRSLCQFEEETDKYGIPSLACKLGHTLKSMAEDLAFEKLKSGDLRAQEEAETFLKLYQRGWSSAVSAKAVRTLQMNKYNKPKLLPLVEDVVKVSKYIEHRLKELEQQEKNTCSYREFCKLLLAQIILFNRKRGGEAERMTVENFKEAQLGGAADSVVLETLNEFEKNLCKTHTRVEIIGKKNRKVPVLLTESMKKNILLLIKMGSKEKISSKFLFAKPRDTRFPLRGVDSLREAVKEAEVKQPELLTSTLLRKQMATLAQVLNLSETSQDVLATFAGHDIRVHRNYYRLPEETIELAKVSKLLHCINDGSIKNFKGMDFDDITFDFNDELDEEDGENEEEEEEDLENTEEEEEINQSHDPKPMTSTPKQKRINEKKTVEKRTWSTAENKF